MKQYKIKEENLKKLIIYLSKYNGRRKDKSVTSKGK